MGSKRFWKWAGFAVFGLVFVWMLWGYLDLQLRVFVAWDQIYAVNLYAQMEKTSNDPKDVAHCLAGIFRYRHERKIGSWLTEMVEIARKAHIQLCIEHLRKLTKKDLGDDPKAWIEEYDK